MKRGMGRAIWILVALAVIAVGYLIVVAPTGAIRTSDPRTLGGPARAAE